MRVTRLLLEDFRSYASAELQPEPGLTVVAGPNGAGKTNLLEAIFVAVTGRSHRAAADSELVRHGQPWARVHLDLAPSTAPADGEGASRLELVIPGPEAPADVRKRVTLNGLARRSSTVGDAVRVVLFRPEEMLLLVGAPGERRRFLDAILAQRSRRVAADLAELGHVLAQRNALLRAIRAETAGADGLPFWDEALAAVGGRLIAARLGLVAELRAALPALHDAVAPADERDDRLELGYLDSLKEAWPGRAAAAGGDGAAADPEALGAELTAALRARIAAVRQKELWNGVSLVGPQRDDLRVVLGGRDVAAHASRGQQRTIILSLKLAETDLLGAGDAPTPIVLLDDVFSELDRVRAERALALLLDRGQVLVTTAQLDAIPARRRRGVAVWQVADGLLTRAPRVA